MRCGSSLSSRTVSRNPTSTVSGVRSSCDTLATKSRRMTSTRSACVTSRDSSIFCDWPNGMSCSDSARPGPG